MRISFIALGIWTAIIAPVLYFSIALKPLRAINEEVPGAQRAALLTSFMDKYKFSKPYYVDDFIRCADEYKISWRLLPAIALQESSGFKRYPVSTNNGLGWNSANYTFQSIPDSICFVSEKLANGTYYKGITLEGKLHAYNPNPEYTVEIKSYMYEINSSR